MNEADNQRAFGFTGSWREFAPIAFTNALLCLVTLGVYLFWARTRERNYLWSRTRFIDDQLEWTGTGRELLVGYMLAIALVSIPFIAINVAQQRLLIQGHAGWAALILLFSYFALLYLTGVAVFRALRYRLSRTYWHGIRGGSDHQGFGFGLSYLGRTVAGSIVLGLLVPWSMTSNWNERWNAMSFGPMAFSSNARSGPIFLRYLLFYLVPFLIVIAVFVVAIAGAAIFVRNGAQLPTPQPGQPPIPPTVGLILLFFTVYFVIITVLGLVAISYYAAFFREAIGRLSLGELEFEFTASTGQWLQLAIGNLLLVIGTLGVGYLFLGYRNWAFFIRHLNAYGEVRLDEMTQSSTREPGQGEGLLDAFDIGAF